MSERPRANPLARFWPLAVVLAGILPVLLSIPTQPAQAAETADWLPLKGEYENAIGCTWNNGCAGDYHGSGAPAIDFAAAYGTEVYAAGSGTIVASNNTCPPTGSWGCSGGRGRFVEISHPDGRHSRYLHLAEAKKTSGDVARGDLIGLVGASGDADGAHLHYDELSGGAKADPGAMKAVHGNSLVEYPGHWNYASWSDVPSFSQTVRNDSFTMPTPPPGSPAGNWEGWARVPGGIKLVGWTADPDTSASNQVHVYVGGTGYAFVADKPRGDVSAIYPGDHGFDVNVPAAEGTHEVCVYGVNVSGTPGANTKIKCQTLVFNSSPIGNFEQIRRAPGGAQIIGWALDQDTSNPLQVHVYHGYCCAGPAGAYVANKLRSDLNGPWPGYGENHGFSDVIPLGPGTHNICVYAINDPGSPGQNALIKAGDVDCRTITVSNDPFGNFEEFTPVAGGAQAKGWAIDPDTGNPIQVHFWEGSYGVAKVADKPRPDVGAANPDYGDNHGFNEFIALSPGTHTMCAYAINDGGGLNTQLGCRSVSVS